MTTCIQCGAQREKPAPPRLPTGWKRSDEVIYCSGCWRSRFVLRAITVPVASPLDCTWVELRNTLSEMWRTTTHACNWMLTQLYAQDMQRDREDKLSPMKHTYLYPELRARFPQLPPRTAAALEHSVQARYRSARYQLIWTCGISLPTYRYPTPYPTPNQAWSLEVDGQASIVNLRIGENRIRLRLKGGIRFRRQRRALEQVAEGSATRGELAIYQRGTDIMVKMVAWLPRDDLVERERGQRTDILYVRTDTERFVVAVSVRNEELWQYHGDHIARWSAEHRAQLQRWLDDTKAEHRPIPPFSDRRERAAQKYRNRMESAAHQIAIMISGYARRRKFAVVQYDDSITTFCPQFPWFRLRELIREKLDAAGIGFEHLTKAINK